MAGLEKSGLSAKACEETIHTMIVKQNITEILEIIDTPF